MKALTVWQPWASLIVAGWKPYEFRRWDCTRAGVVGQRIAIHAGSRMPLYSEVFDILQRMNDGVSALLPDARPGLEALLPLLERWENRGRRPRKHLRSQNIAYDRDEDEIRSKVMLGCVLGTAIVGKPQKAVELFDQPANDSYRMDEAIWAWPMLEVQPLDIPAPVSGAQGFWEWWQ